MENSDNVANTQFYYKVLQLINREIEKLTQTTYRETCHCEQNCRCKCQDECKCLCQNEPRPKLLLKAVNRILRVINKIKKQDRSRNKDESKVFVLTHLGLGDHITAIGLIRYLSTYYDKVVVFYLKKNYENLRLLYEDDPDISFYHCDNFVIPCDVYQKEIFDSITGNHPLIVIGNWYSRFNVYRAPLAFYQQINYNESIFRNYYHIPEKEEYTQLYMLVKNQEPHYAFIHNTSDRGVQFTIEEAEQKMGMSRNDIFFVNPNFNCYEPGTDRHELASKLIGHLVPYYMELIKNSKINFLCDSVFFCMAMNLGIKHDNNFFLTNKNSNYDFLFEEGMVRNRFQNA